FAHLVDDDGTVLDTPIGFADLVPSVQAFAVKQCHPTRILAGGLRRDVVGREGQGAKDERNLNCARACPRHGVSSLLLSFDLLVGARMDEIAEVLSTWTLVHAIPGCAGWVRSLRGRPR